MGNILNPYRFGGAAPSSLLNGLISYWPLNEASGSRADATATGNTLTDNNTVTGNPGKVGNAAQFTAANFESLSHVDNASLSTGDIDFCFAAWMYLDTLANETIGGKYSTAGQREWILYYNHTDHAPNARFTFTVTSNGTTFASIDATTFGAPSTATWYFVVGYHDSVNNLLGISVNDTLNTTAYSAGVFDGTGVFALGALDLTVYAMNGRIDEVGFWKRVLTPAEITTLYNAGVGRTHPFLGT